MNDGITYEGETVYLDADITATTRAGYETGYGTSSHDIKSFQGTFDGQGHTITFNYTANSTYAAPFAYVKNATFLNLKTAGTITANTKRYAGGIAGMVISGSQNCTFTNCESNVTITSTSNGTNDCRHGGFVANVVGGNVTFNGCAFTGGFSGTNAYGWGGFVGFFNHYVYFTDCIFSPTSISIYNQNNYTFACPSGTQVITFTNCYYTQSLGGSQGKQRYTITAESPATVAMSGAATYHNVSHITAYSDNQGLVYNGTIVAGEGDNVNLNLGGGNLYNANHGTLTGSANPYTLSMDANNTIINVVKTHIANTASDTRMTWAEFAQNVNNGYTYEGQTVYMDANVTATTMAGTNETNCFKGTFEGQGHTLTFNYTASGSYYTAPFHYLNGATIQNLKVSGTITANYARCGGLAGDCYGTNAIINCLSNITINSTVNGDGTHGGFISRVIRGTTTFEGCTFAGSLLGENTTANGGFVGWSEGNNNYAFVSFSNCVYAPVANTTNPSAGATFARGRINSTTGITISNCFYTSSEFQYTQGKQLYTITGQSSSSVSMSGTATSYNMSHITAYQGNTGLLYNGTVIAGEGDNVSLYLCGGGSYNADHGTLTGTTNPYTLSMEAYNTIISATIDPASILYSTDFETDCDWVFDKIGGNEANAWAWGTATNNGGTHSIYVSNDDGNNFQYNYSPTYDRLYAYKTFEFEEGDYKIYFDVISGFTWFPFAYYDKLSLWLVPASNHPSQGVEAGGTRLNNTSSVISDWQTMSYEFSILTAGSYRLVFMWECAVGQGYINQYGEDYFYANVYNQPHTPAAIDNVNITQIIGRKPTRLQCTTQGNTATLNWVEYSSNTTAWQICLNGDESNLITTFSKPYTLTGLTYDATYTAKVRTIINNDATYWSDEISFTPTTGNPPTNLQCTTQGNTATLGWTENNSNATTWQICLNGDESNLIDADENPYTLTSLTFDATYTAKVRTITSYGATHWSDEISFTPTHLNPPTNLQCTTQGNTATLGWTENNSTTTWQICLNGDESNLITVTENPYTLTNLTYDATYTAKVRSITSYDVSAWSDEVSFSIVAILPYSTDFETSCNWSFTKLPGHGLYSIDEFNDWAWGTATNNGGTHSIYVSNDGGTSFQYTHSIFLGLMYAYKYFWFEQGAYRVSFDWMGGCVVNSSGEKIDYLQVSLNSDSEPGMGGLYTSPTLGGYADWQTLSFEVNVPASGAYQLVFLWYASAGSEYNYNLGETGYPAAIDNVSITPIGGLKPTDLQCTAANNTQATLVWTENNSNTTGWQICLNGDESNLISVTDNPYTFTGLTTDATYYAKVRSVTTYGESVWSDEIGFVPTIKTVLGTGTETRTELPLFNDGPYGLTQQIYTVAELGAAGDILSIAFHKTGTVACSRNIDIYMVHTTKGEFSSSDGWVAVTDADRVFRGTVNFANDDWTTITLDTPFAYDGLQNVVVTVDDNTGSSGSQTQFLSYMPAVAPYYQAITKSGFGSNIDPTGTIGMMDQILPRKSQIRMLKSSVYSDVTGYGTGNGNWYLVASPLAGETNPVDNSNMMTNTYDLYRFNPSASMEWENWKATGTDHYHFNLESGRGYLYANSANVSLVFSGTPYSGNGQVSLTKDDEARWGEWNLIGNPYATAATIGSKPFYVMNGLGTEIIAASETTIAAMEGIFVKANEDGETITFSNGAKRGESEKEGIVMNLSQNGGSAIDRVIVRFGEGETLPKLQIRDNSPKVYIPQDGKDYAIVRSNGQGELPVGFMPANDGTYTLTVDTKGLEMEYLHLIDNMTGTDIDLLDKPYYTFEARYSDYVSRFKLVFATNEEDGPSTGSGTFAFFDGSAWMISNEGRATLQVIDMLGHVLRSETIDGNATLSTNGLGAGVYIMRLVNGESVKVQKVVVR